MNYGYTRETMPDGSTRFFQAPLYVVPKPELGQLRLSSMVYQNTGNGDFAVTATNYLKILPRTDCVQECSEVNVGGEKCPGGNRRLVGRKIVLNYRTAHCETTTADDQSQTHCWTFDEGINHERGVLAQSKMRLRGARKQRAARLAAKLNTMDLRQEVLTVNNLQGEVVAYDTVRNRNPIEQNQGFRSTSWSSWCIPTTKRLAIAAQDAALERMTWVNPDGQQPRHMAMTPAQVRLEEVKERVRLLLKGGK